MKSFRTLHNVQSFRRVRTLDGLGTLAGRSFFARVLRGLRGFQRQGTDVRDESAPFAAAGALRACSAFQATAEYGTATSRPQPQRSQQPGRQDTGSPPSVTSLQPTRDDPSAMKGWLRRKTASPVPKPTRPPRGPRPPRPAPPKPRRRLKASVTARDNTPGSASSANRSTLIADIPFPAPENVAAKRCASEKRAF